ncbi:MAG: ester cyclase [Dehalococcoidia bacterium]|nr:MAG: ester cyclase [Dehalococcoidia bacterium]
MSTEENKENARRAVEEVLNKGDLSLANELVDANYIGHQPGLPDFKGPEGFRQYMTMMRTAFPDIHLTVEDTVAEGDKVVNRYTGRGTHKGELMGIAPTGKQATITGMVISHYVGGKQVEAWVSSDMLGMLQQLGVAPPVGQA